MIWTSVCSAILTAFAITVVPSIVEKSALSLTKENVLFMRRMNMTSELKYEPIVTDEEICEWMDGELVRLGDCFKGFEISLCRNETHHFLTVWSMANLSPNGCMNQPWGKGFDVGKVVDSFGESIPLLQHEGRKLYHRLKKDYPIHRDLSKGR